MPLIIRIFKEKFNIKTFKLIKIGAIPKELHSESHLAGSPIKMHRVKEKILTLFLSDAGAQALEYELPGDNRIKVERLCFLFLFSAA
jgi:hypothetical protein